jgi:hypothetical protein
MSGTLPMSDGLYLFLAECLESVEHGLPGHLALARAQHPEFKAEIEEFLALHEWVAQLTACLRYAEDNEYVSRTSAAASK